MTRIDTNIGTIYLNPGTEPVADATLTHATLNVIRLLEDADLEKAESTRAPDSDAEDGRYGFLVTLDGEECAIEVPGIPLEAVRYIGGRQNIWDFPRLYVDGTSWVWKYAVPALRRGLLGEDDEFEFGEPTEFEAALIEKTKRDRVLVKCGSHRARNKLFALLGDAESEALYSLQRETGHGGAYRIPAEFADAAKAITGVSGLRDGDDLHKCWNT